MRHFGHFIAPQARVDTLFWL